MKIALIVILLIVLAFALWVRLAPVDPDRWHSDPAAAPTGRAGGFALRPGGDAAGPVLDTSAGALLTRLDTIARATPRTQVVAGSVAEGRITYETRSCLWGFPDYTTASVAAVDAGVTPVIDARLRFGKSDMGVNKARVEAWLSRLDDGGPITD